MTRQRLIVANWKMHKTGAEAVAYAQALAGRLGGPPAVEAVLCAPFTALAALGPALAGSGITLGAQNLHHRAEGAFTGEIAAPMLVALGVRYVIVGHSERRQLALETDELVREKAQAAFAHGLTPILCVGEAGVERERGETEAVVERMVQSAVQGRTRGQCLGLVIAYEPVWAIGSGRTPTPADAATVAGFIRQLLARLFDDELAQAVRLLYGGSVRAGNIGPFLRSGAFDGSLVGGASLDPEEFAAILAAAAP